MNLYTAARSRLESRTSHPHVLVRHDLHAVPDPRTKATQPPAGAPPPFCLFFLDLTLEQTLMYEAVLPLQGEFYSHPHQFSILGSPATRSAAAEEPSREQTKVLIDQISWRVDLFLEMCNLIRLISLPVDVFFRC